VTVNWGVISTAAINGQLLEGARQAAGLTVVAVASRDRDRAVRYAHDHGIERAYGSYDALLADDDIEAVYISLPNSMHIGWTTRALRAGKHVLCEKPLGRRVPEVVAVFDEAARQERLLMEAFMYRHNPLTLRVQELVAQGAIGRLRLIRAAFSYLALDGEDVRFSAGLDGGSLMDVGCYCVSAARMLAGEPERVAGEQTLGGDGVDIAFAGTLRFAHDVISHFDAGLVLASRDQLEVVGEDGSLLLDDPWHCRHAVIELRRDGRAELIEIPAIDSYRLELENLSAAIRGTAEPLLGRDDAIGQARTIAALYESAETGRMVTLR
jgi:xylose dehydrogenase (NAD/NADP)